MIVFSGNPVSANGGGRGVGDGEGDTYQNLSFHGLQHATHIKVNILIL